MSSFVEVSGIATVASGSYANDSCTNYLGETVTESAGSAGQRKSRVEGQWAAGDRQPLNDNERIKQEDDGLNVRRRIEEVYSKTGIAGVDLTDRRSRFRWWGMYTQRKPGIPGNKIGSIAPEDLEDDCFMMRVRIDGGALTTEQLRVLGEVSREFASDTADLTDRQNVQLHWVYVENVPEIWRRIEAVGLTTVESAGDTPRVVLGSPLAGIAADEVLDITPGIADITGRLLSNPEYSNLPVSSRPRSPGCRTWPMKSTTSRSSECTIPSTGRAWTCGSVAGCRPIPRSLNGSVRGCRSPRSARCGKRLWPCFVTTATVGSGTRRG